MRNEKHGIKCGISTDLPHASRGVNGCDSKTTINDITTSLMLYDEIIHNCGSEAGSCLFMKLISE